VSLGGQPSVEDLDERWGSRWRMVPSSSSILGARWLSPTDSQALLSLFSLTSAGSAGSADGGYHTENILYLRHSYATVGL